MDVHKQKTEPSIDLTLFININSKWIIDEMENVKL